MLPKRQKRSAFFEEQHISQAMVKIDIVKKK